MWNQDKCVKHSTDQVQVNSSTWYLITTPETPGVTQTTDYVLTVSLGVALHFKKPLPTMWGRWRDQLTLCWAPKVVCPTIMLEWLGNSEMHSKLPWLEAVGRAVILHSWCGPLTIIRRHICLQRGKLQRVVVSQTPKFEPPLVNTATTWEPKRRTHTP